MTNIQTFRSVAKISGTTNQPVIDVTSDLGPRFAAVLQEVITNQQDKAQRLAYDKVNAAKISELQWLDAEVLPQLNLLGEQIRNESVSVARVNRVLEKSSSNLDRKRF